MKITLKDIYYEFFLLGLQMLGGGYVLLPLMKKSIVENKHWLSDEEITDYFALSQSLPGLIAINISVFAGYKLKGKSGAFLALSGIITSPAIIILLIASFIDKFMQLSFINGLFYGVGVSVILLMFLSVKEMLANTHKDIFTVIVFILAFIASFVYKISPVIIVLTAAFSGICYNLLKENLGKIS